MYDLAINLQYDSTKCLYEQIYEHIKGEIKSGKLLSGERLPSTRSLAEYLQISRSTVAFAYEQLLSEGYIESKPYKGYFVCKLEELPENSTIHKEKYHQKSDPVKRKEEEYLFSPNGLDMSVFPYGVWKKITRNILNESNTELFSSGEPQGDYILRETISRYLHSARGVNCTPKQIIVGAGNDYLLLLLEKLLGRNAHIAMENATYMRAYRIFRSFGYHIKTVQTDEYGMQVDDLQKMKVTAAYVMPSHQYPTGITMPIGRRMELLKWAANEDCYIIEDDYDSEFRYRGKPIPSLQGADTNGKVIYMGTFSKAIAPAIRVSYMVLPFPLLKRYEEECYFYSSTVSRIDQRILNEFINDGYFERYLNKTRKIYREKHDILLQELKPFSEKFIIVGEHAGLHLLLQCKMGDDSEEELIEKAAALGVGVYGIRDCVIDNQYKMPPTIILGYGGMKKEEIQEGIKKLKQAWL